MLHKPLLAVLLVLALAALACKGTSQPGKGNEDSQNSGEEIFQEMGCAECHVNGAGIAAPSLGGLFGAEVKLESGETVTADEAYLRESILSPQAEIVQGYQPIMPDFEDRLSEEQLAALVDYVRSLED